MNPWMPSGEWLNFNQTNTFHFGMNIVVADRTYLGSLQCEQYCQYVAFAFEQTDLLSSQHPNTQFRYLNQLLPRVTVVLLRLWNCPTFHSYGFKVGRTIDVFDCSRKSISYSLYDVAWSVVVCSVLGLPQFFHKDLITSRLSMVC